MEVYQILSSLPFVFIASALGIAVTMWAALAAVGRNPEAADKIQPLTIIGTAFIEAISIYALIIFMILKFT